MYHVLSFVPVYMNVRKDSAGSSLLKCSHSHTHTALGRLGPLLLLLL